MTPVQQPKHPALRGVYWREEVLEVVCWRRGEGLGQDVDSRVLCTFLDLQPEHATALLEELASQGYLQPLAGGRYTLTRMGEEEAERLTGTGRAVAAAGPGGCGPACWCGTSPSELARCATSTVA